VDARDPPLSFAERLRHIRLLVNQQSFEQAIEEAEALDREVPQQRDVLYARAVAHRLMGRLDEALRLLDELADRTPEYARTHQERGHCLGAKGATAEARHAYEQAVRRCPTLIASWVALEQLYSAEGREPDALNATRQLARLRSLPSDIVEAFNLLADGEFDHAEELVRQYHARHGEHPEGLRLLARIALRFDLAHEAEILLERVLGLVPDYRDARLDYALALLRRNRHLRALKELERLLVNEPRNRLYRLLRAQALAGLGKHELALEVLDRLHAEAPADGEVRILRAWSLRMLGRREEAINVYRDILALPNAQTGEAWWGLADLKVYRFSDADIERMRADESSRDTDLSGRCHVCFALGKALEDRGAFEESFRYYERGNALKKQDCRYRPEPLERSTRLFVETFTGDYVRSRTLQAPARAREHPIFIVGMPRSGSTLVEQILAAHSQVEATLELPIMPRLAQDIQGRDRDEAARKHALESLQVESLRALGVQYLSEAAAYRHGKAHFIDKMPNNFRHLGLILLALPEARVIDARRSPMACCFSNFKQLFAAGQQFAYSMEDLGRYYRMYVEVMEHWVRVFPGRILRIDHETLVENLEGEVRRMLEFCELDFEPACLEFHRNDRVASTASSEQVRRPITREGIDQWRRFEPWLGPLQEALGALAAEHALGPEKSRATTTMTTPGG
jgi:tetratricopeptide (TPR) repeat protein